MLTIIYNSSSRGFNTLFWLPRAIVMQCANKTLMYIKINLNLINPVLREKTKRSKHKDQAMRTSSICAGAMVRWLVRQLTYGCVPLCVYNAPQRRFQITEQDRGRQGEEEPERGRKGRCFKAKPLAGELVGMTLHSRER